MSFVSKTKDLFFFLKEFLVSACRRSASLVGQSLFWSRLVPYASTVCVSPCLHGLTVATQGVCSTRVSRRVSVCLLTAVFAIVTVLGPGTPGLLGPIND